MATVEGNFRLIRPKTMLAFTGERMTTSVEGQIEFEHLHRYCLARDFCAGRDVLDIASGEGYGAAILAGPARNVVGIEIDPASVGHARAAYALPNLRFEEGDAHSIPLPDDAVDVVVSFETLEHLDDPAGFLVEIRRVLRQGGLLVISTPDRQVYSAPGSDANPYHRLEYTLEEFSTELGRHFTHLTLLRQRPVLGSAMLPVAPDVSGPTRTYERRAHDIIEASGGLARAPYLVALASDSELPPVGSSHYIDRRSVHRVCEDLARLPDLERRLGEAEHAVAERSSAAERLLADRNREVEERLEAIRADGARDRSELALALAAARRDLEDAARRQAALTYDLEEARAVLPRVQDAEARLLAAEARVKEANRQAQAGEAERNRLREALAQEHEALLAAARFETAAERSRADAVLQDAAAIAARLAAVEASTSWRALAPLRGVGRRLPRTARLARRTAKLLWWTATLQLGARYLQRRDMRRTLAAAQTASEITIIQPVAPPPVVEGPPLAPARAAVDLRCEAARRNRFQAIHFPAAAPPRVSVIIPVYGGVDELTACLRSLAATVASEPPFEVILADDKPGDRATAGLPRSPGLRVFENPENFGFLRNCNRAAARAEAEFLLFLNSDTLVMPGWLGALVAAAEADPRTGIVGSMLLNTNGTIQDAGWRITGDGWGYPLGRGISAESSAHAYRRQADCVTGASLLVRHSVFDELGGFDDALAPAFYEEFDLAFRAWERGWRTVYEPASRVVHLGSASYGAAERDRLSTRNHAMFVRRFAERLRRQPWTDTPEFLLRQAVDTGPAILVVDDTVPRPDRHAGGVTLSQYLGLMAEAGWRVIFAPHDGIAEGEAAEVLKRQGIEVLPGGAPAIDAWLAENGRYLRNAWIARPAVAPSVLPALRAHSSAFVAYYTHDLHHRRQHQEAALHGNDPAMLAEANAMQEAEVAIFGAVDCVMSPNASESDTIQALSPGTRVVTVPPYFADASEVDLRDAAGFADLKDIVFVGGFPHIPNVDAAIFTAREVMPRIWRRVPEARLILVGYAPPPEVQSLAGERVIVTGQVPDLVPYFLNARLSLAALRYGAGVKGKVVQAMQLGTPLVTTPVGAEGLELSPGEHALVAADAEGLAEAAVGLLLDAERSAVIGAAGMRFIRDRLSRKAVRAALSEVFGAECCRICGSTHLAAPHPSPTREDFVCDNCYALARSAGLAEVMLNLYARDGSVSLAEMSRRAGLPRTLEIGFTGAISEILRGDSAFQNCEYFDGVPIGQPGQGGVRNEDVARLTFADASYDVIISQEVMEHVPDPRRGFEEMRRVLRPGGRLLFTMPVDWGRSSNVTRAVIENGRPRFLLEPEYHGDPIRKEGALVFTSYGAEAPGFVESCGFVVQLHRVRPPGSAVTVEVFEATRSPA